MPKTKEARSRSRSRSSSLLPPPISDETPSARLIPEAGSSAHTTSINESGGGKRNKRKVEQSNGNKESDLGEGAAVKVKVKVKVNGHSNVQVKVQEQGEDEFQQVTLESFVGPYGLDGLGYGADVYYKEDLIPESEAREWYDELMILDTYQPMLKMYGRTFPQSRKIAAYSTIPDAKLKYSGTEVIMHHPFPPALDKMRSRLEGELGVRFNHCMLNLYEDGGVYIGKHSDNLNNLVIASVSLGAERTFILSPRLPSKIRAKGTGMVKSSSGSAEADDEVKLADRKNVKLSLRNGSLLVMQGQTQEYWKHEIPKEPKIKEGRISATFRQLV